MEREGARECLCISLRTHAHRYNPCYHYPIEEFLIMPVPSADSTPPEIKPVLQPPPPPLLGFSADEFQIRRSALRKAIPEGIILLRGSTEDEAVNPGRYQQ